MNGRNIVNQKLYLYPKIVVSMTDRDIIDRVSALFGTGTYVIPNKAPDTRKDAFRAQINGAKAAVLMTKLKPIMGQRRGEKIDEILKEYGELESTEVRRARSCSESQTMRWAQHGTRHGKLEVENK